MRYNLSPTELFWQVYSGFGADRTSSDGLPGSCPVSSSTDIRGTHCTGMCVYCHLLINYFTPC